MVKRSNQPLRSGVLLYLEPECHVCTRGQLLCEWNHLKVKLKSRDAEKYLEIKGIKEPGANPIFKIIDGAVEDWEIVA